MLKEGIIMAENKPRNSRESDILEILTKMQARTHGVCINDIMEEYNVSRSTAERWLDAIKLIIPQIEEIENPNTKKKYWGFKHGYMTEIIKFSPEEIANLETIKKEQEKKGFKNKAELLQKTLANISIFGKKHNIKIDNTIEILLQTEGFAVFQRPKFNINLNHLSIIREAMNSNKKITAKYNNKNKILCPYGLIYGEKIYLIAVENKKTIPYYYLLHKINDVQLTRETFDKGDFNLEDFSKKSFGIYQGKINDVKLLFSKNVAEDVLHYNFHSTQKVKQNDDGTVTVRFKASGEYSIMWHLFKWGDDVKILAPTSLKEQYINLLSKTLNKQKEK